MAATEVAVEEVASNLEEAAAAVRTLDTKALGFLLGGIVIGVGVGFYFGYRYNREKLRQEAFEDTQEEVQRLREYYGRNEKRDLEEIVEERGYSQVTPEPDRPLPPPVPVREPEPARLPLEPVQDLKDEELKVEEKDKNAGWSFPAELARRTEHRPYILHQDEYMENESEFSQVTLTYYEVDGILADVDDSVLRPEVVGVDHLSRFGHGADSYDVLYVRNPHLEMEYEICRVQKSFEVEVRGLDDNPENPPTEES